MNEQKITLLDKLYMAVLVLLPVLSQYQVGPLDLDVVIMAFFFFAFLVSNRYLTITRFNQQIFTIVIYIVVITVLNMLVGKNYSQDSEIILRAGRYCLYLLLVFFLGNKHVSYEQLMRIYRVVAILACAYLMIQAVFYYGAGITLPNKLGGSSHSENGAEVGRLRSFYSEPAELGYNLLPFLACSLFGAPYRRKGNSSYFDALLVSVAVVISTSGQGVIAAAVLWGIWLVMRIWNKQFKTGDAVLVIVVAIAAFVLYQSGILEYTLGRVETDNAETGAIAARSSGYRVLQLLSPLERLFGTGFGNYVVENVFDLGLIYDYVNYSSIAEFLFTLGIFGTLLWALFFYTVFRSGKLCSRALLAALLVLSLLGCPMTGKHFPLWLTLICIQLPKGQFSGKPTHEPEQT